MNWLTLIDPTAAVILARALLHSLWEGMVVVGGLTMLSPLAQRCSSRARYAALLIALLLVTACPVITYFALLESSLPVQSEASPAESSTNSVKPESATPPNVSTATSRTSWSSYAPLVIAMYEGGVLIMLARLLWAVHGGHRLIRASEPVEDVRVLQSLARQVRNAGLTYTPAVAYCEKVLVPCVVGTIRPMLLLPLIVTTGLTPDQLEFVLAHELAHIRRYDHAINLLQRLIEAVLFYHPAVWFLTGRIRRERECCCDDIVLENTGNGTAYAQALVDAAKLASVQSRIPEPSLVTLAATGQISELSYRVERMLTRRHVQMPRLKGGATTIVAALSLILVLAPLVLPVQASRAKQDTHLNGPAAWELAAYSELCVAAERGNLENVKAILARGIKPNVASEQPWTPLHFAVANGHLGVVRLLLEKGAFPNATGNFRRTPLHLACGLGGIGLPSKVGDARDAITQLLLEFHARPDARDSSGMSPLHCAAFRGWQSTAKVLLDAHASVDATDNSKRTPLHAAALHGNESVVALLLRRGADKSAKDVNGLTPLHLCGMATDPYSAVGKVNSAKALMDAGADVNASANDGSRPLHSALANRKPVTELIAVLLGSGADPSLSDDAGRAPADRAPGPLSDQIRQLLDQTNHK